MKQKGDSIKIVICAAGTGGHIYPAIAVADKIKETNIASSVIFFASSRSSDREIFADGRYRVFEISSADLRSLFSLKFPLAVLLIVAGFFKSLFLLLWSRPDIIFSTGGYTSFPAVIAGYILRIPIVLHEQNVLPGKTNRLLARLAQKIAVSFDESSRYLRSSKVEYTGNPVRRSILEIKEKTSFDGGTVAFIGGSQGALSINDAVIGMLPLLGSAPAVKRIIHITGRADHERINDLRRSYSGPVVYEPHAYMKDMSGVLSDSDLIVSRAGATMIAEITACGLPSVLIPYPFASEKHQDINAGVLKDKGAALVLSQDKLSARSLLDIISPLIADPGRLRHMSVNSSKLAKKNAVERILDLLYETI